MKIRNRKNSIIKKMIFIFILTMLFPSVLISNMYYNIIGMSYRNNIMVHFNTVFEQYISSIEYQLGQYRQLMSVISDNNEIRELVKNPDPKIVFDISSRYLSNQQADGYIYRCAVYSKESPPELEFSFERAKDEEWFCKNYSEGRYGFWFADKSKGQGVPLLSITYPIWCDVINYKSPDGILKLDLYTDKLIERQFPKNWEGVVDCIVFLDTEQVIWETGQNTDDLKQILSKSDGAENLLENEELGELIRCGKINNHNIYILCKVQPSFIRSSASGDYIHFILQFVIVILSIFIVWGIYMKSFSKRINTIIGKIKKIEQLDFSDNGEKEEKTGDDDEFALINDTLDVMSQRLDRLIYENYEQKLQTREAELKMLNFQINPHFLYNVLESISEIAYIEGSQKAADMSRMLGKMFRYTTETTDSFCVPFDEELKYIRYYIEIQNVRFSDKFTLSVDADDELGQEKILKFSLQPIIENAVKYAFSGRKRGLISIKAIMENRDLVISVSDDGIGMSDETLHILCESFKNADNNYEGGIGLKNVNNRLIRAYGEDYRMKIHSEKDNGTEVTLKFKVKENPNV